MGPGCEMEPGEVIDLAMKLRLLAFPTRSHRRKRLVGDAGTLAVRDPQQVRFALQPAKPRPKDHPTAGKLVGSRDHLGEHQGMAVRNYEDGSPDLDPAGDACHVRHDSHRFVERGSECLHAGRGHYTWSVTQIESKPSDSLRIAARRMLS